MGSGQEHLFFILPANWPCKLLVKSVCLSVHLLIMLSPNLLNFWIWWIHREFIQESYINGPVIKQLLLRDQKLGTLKVLARSSGCQYKYKIIQLSCIKVIFSISTTYYQILALVVLSALFGIIWYFQFFALVLFGILWYLQILVLVLVGIIWYFQILVWALFGIWWYFMI